MAKAKRPKRQHRACRPSTVIAPIIAPMPKPSRRAQRAFVGCEIDIEFRKRANHADEEEALYYLNQLIAWCAL